MRLAERSRFSLVVLALLCLAQASHGLRGRGRHAYEGQKGAFKPPAPAFRSFGLSAWGIVTLVIASILIGVGAYYSVMFYPLLCKKERKYDRIDPATA